MKTLCNSIKAAALAFDSFINLKFKKDLELQSDENTLEVRSIKKREKLHHNVLIMISEIDF